ncbi:MAG: UbiX family flavin prenyltransferase [Tenuifilaceae bacterium]
MKAKKIIVAVTGASGSIYAQHLLDKIITLKNTPVEIALIFSESGKKVWQYELGDIKIKSKKIKQYSNDNFFAPSASGSAGFDGMVIIPCTMGTLGRIASGTSEDLISRSADVMLKERKKLILVTRETPLNLIHIENMKTITLAGGIIFPASPSFYSKPNTIEELEMTVVNRVLDILGIESDIYRWGSDS